MARSTAKLTVVSPSPRAAAGEGDSRSCASGVREKPVGSILEKRAERLRRLIRERDAALSTVATCDRHIQHEARRWADAQGLTLRPTIEQLKRELFA